MSDETFKPKSDFFLIGSLKRDLEITRIECCLYYRHPAPSWFAQHEQSTAMELHPPSARPSAIPGRATK